MSNERRRRSLPHEPPSWIDGWNELWFVTICCRKRGVDSLCNERVASGLFDSFRHRNDRGIWFLRYAVLMPDHLHALISFPVDGRMQKTVSEWKRFTARGLGVQWQRDFFDHRLRSEESESEKADYIRNNPVRAGLVGNAEDWPYVFEGEANKPEG